MAKMRIAAALAGMALLGAAGQACAHHAFSMYDNTQYTKMSGTVKSYLWANPHTMVDFVVVAPGGKLESWTAELSPINMLGRRGWASDSLKPGDKIDFVIHPNRSGANYGLLVSATKTDGSVLHDKD
jgi:uncharacterized cupredoxin-like copper-binding protein